MPGTNWPTTRGVYAHPAGFVRRNGEGRHIAKSNSPSKSAVAKSPADEQAAGKLRVAKLLLQNKPELAKARLTELIDQFPDTAAAKEAAEVLRQLSD